MGYTLDKAKYNRMLRGVTELAGDMLDKNLTIRQQDNIRLLSFYKACIERWPMFADYERQWPLVDIVTQYLKNKVLRRKRDKAENAAEAAKEAAKESLDAEEEDQEDEEFGVDNAEGDEEHVNGSDIERAASEQLQDAVHPSNQVQQGRGRAKKRLTIRFKPRADVQANRLRIIYLLLLLLLLVCLVSQSSFTYAYFMIFYSIEPCSSRNAKQATKSGTSSTHASHKSSALASASKKSRATLARRSQSTESEPRPAIDIDAPISESAVRETLVGDSSGDDEDKENPTDDRYDFDAPSCPIEDCHEQLNQKPSEHLQHLLDKRPVRGDRSEGDYELSVLGWEAEICKGIKHENILAHNLDIGWPATIDYSGLMARVFALRSVLEEVIEDGQNGFIYQRLLECIGDVDEEETESTLEELNKVMRTSVARRCFASDLCVGGYYGLHGRTVIHNSVQIMFPEHDAVWSSLAKEAMAPLKIAAICNFVLTPEVLLRLLQADAELTEEPSLDLEEALEMLQDDRANDHGRLQLDEDPVLETSFCRLSAKNLMQIKNVLVAKSTTRKSTGARLKTASGQPAPRPITKVLQCRPPPTTAGSTTQVPVVQMATEKQTEKKRKIDKGKQRAQGDNDEQLTLDMFPPPAPPKRSRKDTTTEYSQTQAGPGSSTTNPVRRSARARN
ncbi:hypothetical protein BC629DRAFT_1588714 [Irpex lacteus]|nr:hypothetical protein BC629DRAFT_1588714 [Irpex lacteus]